MGPALRFAGGRGRSGERRGRCTTRAARTMCAISEHFTFMCSAIPSTSGETIILIGRQHTEAQRVKFKPTGLGLNPVCLDDVGSTTRLLSVPSVKWSL